MVCLPQCRHVTNGGECIHQTKTASVKNGLCHCTDGLLMTADFNPSGSSLSSKSSGFGFKEYSKALQNCGAAPLQGPQADGACRLLFCNDTIMFGGHLAMQGAACCRPLANRGSEEGQACSGLKTENSDMYPTYPKHCCTAMQQLLALIWAIVSCPCPSLLAKDAAALP